MVSRRGELGQFALPHAEEGVKIGQGRKIFVAIKFKAFVIVNYRAKVMDAKNNGEQCASTRILDLAETDTCNRVFQKHESPTIYCQNVHPFSESMGKYLGFFPFYIFCFLLCQVQVQKVVLLHSCKDNHNLFCF